MYTLYGSRGSGSAAVEAALEWVTLRYRGAMTERAAIRTQIEAVDRHPSVAAA